jgi:hypothetical protein
METRISALELLPARDRALVEERNKVVYAASNPPELVNLASWLDEKTLKITYPNESLRSRMNDARYGPTAQFLYSGAPKTGDPFSVLATAMGRWGYSEPQWPGEVVLDERFIQAFAKIASSLIATGDPLEPYATPGREVRFSLNDFPDQPLWTLHREGSDPVLFDDWPKSWHRPKSPGIGIKPRGKYDQIWWCAMAQYRDNVASEERNHEHLLWQVDLARSMAESQGEPFSALAGLALRRWHWRNEIRRQAIEALDRADRELLQARTFFFLGQREFPNHPQFERLKLPDNNYIHFFGISWGRISPARILSLRNVLQWGGSRYGPNVGYFYSKAVESGGGDEEAIELMKQWAETEPPSYPEFLRQAEAGAPDYGLTEAVEHWFQKDLVWNRTEDFSSYYETQPMGAEGRQSELTVRINDFPDERLFSLLEEGEQIGDFNDWPRNWEREERKGTTNQTKGTA